MGASPKQTTDDSGDGRNFLQILKFPDSLGQNFTAQNGRGFAEGELGRDKQSLNQEPYVMFLPYKRPLGFSQLASSQGGTAADVFAAVPETAKEYIVLPLPSSALKTQHQAEYGEVELGQIPAFINTVSGAASGMMNAVMSGQGAAASAVSFAAAVGKGAGQIGEQSALAFFQALQNLPGADAIGKTAQAAAGFADNPFAETMFKSVRFREHRFDYEFSPLYEEEAETIDRVIQRFKYYMLPDMTSLAALVTGDTTDTLARSQGLIMSFPYQFIIRYSVESTTFRLMPSVLKSVSVDYGGQDKAPAFYRSGANGKNWPSRINLALEFQEIVFLTRSRVATDEKSYVKKTGAVRYRF